MARITASERDIIAKYEAFVEASTLCTDIHRDYRADKKFVELDMQWEASALAARNQEITPRPSLVINLCRQFSYLVTNEAAKMKVGGKILPVGMGANEKTAEIYEGLVRAIQRTSNADAAYDHGLQDAVNGGYGAFRVVPEYESDDSFDQCLKIKRIMDATSVRWDNNSTEPDFSDMMVCSFSEQMTKNAFEQEYGKDALKFYTVSNTPDADAWGDKDGPVVTEFWYIEMKPETLFQLTEMDESGIPRTAWASELVSAGGDVPDESIAMESVGFKEGELGPEEVFEPISRESKRRYVKWCKLAGGRVLKKVDWPGYWIPIFLIAGREVVVDGLHKFVSMIRPMKDSQRVYNYTRSSQVERLALAPKSPWIAPEDAISPQEKKKWDTANTKNYSVLKYKQYDDQGRQQNKPERGQPISSDPALTEEAQITTNELKAVTGKYDPSVGKNQGDQSGKAIIALQDQGDTATFDFINNRNTAIEHCMRVIVDLIPYYYDTPRQIMIVNGEDKQELVTINSKHQNANGETINHDLTVGKYKLAYEVGPDRKTRLQANAEMMQGLAQAVPQAGMTRPDLLYKQLAASNGLDPQLTTEMEESLRAMLPPPVQEQLAQKKNGGGQPPIPPQVLQALAQADQEADAMEAQIAELTSTRQIEERKLAIDEYKAETDRIKILIESGASVDQAIIASHTEMEKEHIRASAGHAGKLAELAAQPSSPEDAGSTEPSNARQTAQTGLVAPSNA